MGIIEKLASEHNKEQDKKISPSSEEKIKQMENTIDKLTSRIQYLETAIIEINHKISQT